MHIKETLNVAVKNIFGLAIYLLIAAGLVFAIVFLNKNFIYNMAITAKFSDLGPIYTSMPVYYKGYKIGKTTKIEPSDDYKYTLVKIILYPKKLALPSNTTVKVQKAEFGKNYMDLIYPQEPSLLNLKNGSIIEGKTAVDLRSFMSAQADSGALGEISGNMTQALASLDMASQFMGDFFEQLSLMVEENRPNVQRATLNAAQTLENMNKMSAKLNHSVDKTKISSTVNNVEQTSINIEETTKNMAEISKNLNQATENIDETFEKIDSSVTNANKITEDIKGITTGMKRTLSKRLGGMRVMFGKPVERKPPYCK